MSIWPPGQQNNRYLIFQCPCCDNGLQFTAVRLGEQLLWHCPVCGNHVDLNLAAVRAHPFATAGFDGCHAETDKPIQKSSTRRDAKRIH